MTTLDDEGKELFSYVDDNADGLFDKIVDHNSLKVTELNLLGEDDLIITPKDK